MMIVFILTLISNDFFCYCDDEEKAKFIMKYYLEPYFKNKIRRMERAYTIIAILAAIIVGVSIYQIGEKKSIYSIKNRKEEKG